MNPNEISVEMRLRLDKLRQDAKQAGQVIRQAGRGGLATAEPDLEASGRDQVRRERINRARRNAALDMADAKREAKEKQSQLAKELAEEVQVSTRRNQARRLLRQREVDRSNRPIQGPDLSGDLRRHSAISTQRDKEKFMQNIGFASLPAFSGRPSLLGTFFSARQSFKAFGETQTGQGIMSKAGLSGPSGALIAAGVVTAASVAVGAALMALRKVAAETAAAMEAARKSYAKILTSGGMAPGFIIKREQLASIIGVSEEQVMQYGAAVNYLNERLSFSSKILTDTNPTLTSLGWRFRIVNEDMKALWATLANDAAPAIKTVLDSVDGLVKGFTGMYQAIMGNKLGKLLMGFAIKAGLGGLSPLLPISGVAANTGDKAPQTAVSINRLQSSNFEKMGLVIGRGPGSDHVKRTADNTTKMVELLTKIVGNSPARSGAVSFAGPHAAYNSP